MHCRLPTKCGVMELHTPFLTYRLTALEGTLLVLLTRRASRPVACITIVYGTSSTEELRDLARRRAGVALSRLVNAKWPQTGRLICR